MATIIFMQAMFMAISIFGGIGIGYEAVEYLYPDDYVGFKSKGMHKTCLYGYLFAVIATIIGNSILYTCGGIKLFFTVAVLGAIGATIFTFINTYVKKSNKHKAQITCAFLLICLASLVTCYLYFLAQISIMQ